MSRGCSVPEEDLEIDGNNHRNRNVPLPAKGGGQGGSWGRGSEPNSSHNSHNLACDVPVCMKCKQQPAQVSVRQHEPLCSGCLWNGVTGKMRNTLRGKFNILADRDHVMVGVSGGAASLAMLHCLTTMQNPSSARAERGKVQFDMQVVHIEEGELADCTAQEVQEHVAALRASVAAAGFRGQVLVVPLHDVYADECITAAERSARLQALLQGVQDRTGRQDLVTHLRRHLLLSCAASAGCNKIVLGDCASRTAAAVVAAVAKGRGYGLPGDIQALDARHAPEGAAFLYPMREISFKELAVLCQFQRLPLAPPPRIPPSSPTDSVNALADAFLANISHTMPASIYTVLRTASHLQTFQWNAPPPQPPRRERFSPVDARPTVAGGGPADLPRNAPASAAGAEQAVSSEEMPLCVSGDAQASDGPAGTTDGQAPQASDDAASRQRAAVAAAVCRNVAAVRRAVPAAVPLHGANTLGIKSSAAGGNHLTHDLHTSNEQAAPTDLTHTADGRGMNQPAANTSPDGTAEAAAGSGTHQLAADTSAIDTGEVAAGSRTGQLADSSLHTSAGKGSISTTHKLSNGEAHHGSLSRSSGHASSSAAGDASRQEQTERPVNHAKASVLLGRLCGLCSAPLMESEVESMVEEVAAGGESEGTLVCCTCCRDQIVSKFASNMAGGRDGQLQLRSFLDALPRAIRDKLQFRDTA